VIAFEDALSRLHGVRRRGDDQASALCPAHDDSSPSLSLTKKRDGSALLKCHAGCTYESILRALGHDGHGHARNGGAGRHAAPLTREVCTYDYTDAAGKLLYQVVRFEPKAFRFRRPDGRGGWIWSLDGIRLVPYRLHELAEIDRVFVVEGEKDCDALGALGLVATCNHGGAGKWRDEHTRALVEAAVPEVVVLRDADPAGATHQQLVATSCVRAGLRVKCLELPGLPPKGDVSDYIAARRAAGRTDDDIRALLEGLTHAAPVFQPGSSASGTTAPASGAAPIEVIAQLRAVRAAAVIDEPPPVEIVEGVAWQGNVTVLVAESGAGKTFITLGISADVNNGRSWFGRRTSRGSVAYFAWERDALSLRLCALRDVAGQSLEYLHIIRPTAPISPRIDHDRIEHPSPGELELVALLDELRGEIEAVGEPPIRLIVFDTVRCSMSGSEDNSETVSAYLRAVRRVMAHAPEAGAILLHHSGWQDGEAKRRRERGSSAWRGNGDGTIYVEAREALPRGGARLELRTLKVRDGEVPDPLHLIRRRVDLPIVGPDGLPRTSCLIERDPRSGEEREAASRAAADEANAAVDLRVLKLIAEKPAMATSVRQMRAAVALGTAAVTDAVVRLLTRDWIVPPAKQREPYTVTDAGRDALKAGISGPRA
jgi:hypothetical protein